MCEKTVHENDTFIGRQEHFAPNYETGKGDQDRQTEKISQVGEFTRSENGMRRRETKRGECRAPAHIPKSFMEWLAEETQAIGLPTRSKASEMAFLVARSVAYRKQLRAERAQL